MSHHVFVAKKPMKHHVGFGVLVGLIVAGVVVGWTLTTGRAVLASMASAQQDLTAAVQTAKQVRDQVMPAPAPAPAPAAKPASPNFDPVIQQMKAKLEATQATTK